MRRVSIIISLFFTICNNYLIGQTLKKIENISFKRGEYLKFKVYYSSIITGSVTAGEASIEVSYENKKFAGRSTYHVIGYGRTKSFFNWFFKVEDRYETYIDEELLVPWLFIRRVNEGGYILNQDIYFNRNLNTAKDLIKNKLYTNLPDDIQDLLSAYYYARNFDCSNMKINEEILINTYIDFEVYPLKLKYKGKEKIKTNIGGVGREIICLKFIPVLQVGNIFREKEGMTIWFSDDNNHLPILAEAKILVGSIKMELIDYKNLLNPINIYKK